jgi:hypothetical protein
MAWPIDDGPVGELTMAWPIISGTLVTPEDIYIRKTAEAAGFLVLTASEVIDDERVLTAGSNISFVDDGTTLTISAENMPADVSSASFLVLSASEDLPNERVLTAGTNISFVESGSTLTISADEPPTDLSALSFLVLTASEDLSNERVLTAGDNISFADDGSTLTISADGAFDTTKLPSLVRITDASTTYDAETTILTEGLPSGTIYASARMWCDTGSHDLSPVYLKFIDSEGTQRACITSSYTSRRDTPFISFQSVAKTFITCTMNVPTGSALGICERVTFMLGSASFFFG